MSRKCLLTNSITGTNQQTNAADDTHTHTHFSCTVAASSSNQNSFFPSLSLSSSIHIHAYSFQTRLNSSLAIVEQYSEKKNFLLSFIQHKRENQEKSRSTRMIMLTMQVWMYVCAYIYIYMHTRRLLLFASLVIEICTHSFSHSSHDFLFFSSFILSFLFSCLLDVQLVDR